MNTLKITLLYVHTVRYNTHRYLNMSGGRFGLFTRLSGLSGTFSDVPGVQRKVAQLRLYLLTLQRVTA